MKSHLAQRERRYKIHESGAELSIYEYYHVSGKRRDFFGTSGQEGAGVDTYTADCTSCDVRLRAGICPWYGRIVCLYDGAFPGTVGQ